MKKNFEPVDVNSNSFLRRTNFKMETDEKMMSFETTHGEYFPVRVLDKFRNSKADWRMKMQSCIPQGKLVLCNLVLDTCCVNNTLDFALLTCLL